MADGSEKVTATSGPIRTASLARPDALRSIAGPSTRRSTRLKERLNASEKAESACHAASRLSAGSLAMAAALVVFAASSRESPSQKASKSSACQRRMSAAQLRSCSRRR
eukprot:1943111-Pleurochrysis_carterae.AAC.1